MPTGSSPVRGRLGVVTKNVVSLYKEPSAASERVTQALIGQPVVAEAGQGDWLFVQTWDTYRGWIPAHAVRITDDAPEPYAASGNVAVIRDLFVEILEQPRDGAMVVTRAPISVELEVIGTRGDWVELRLPDESGGYIRSNEARLVIKEVAQTIPLPDPRKLLETAARLIGTPYLWGGVSPFGIDCSGFVQLVHKIHGVTLLRDSRLQASDKRGAPVEREKLRAGDLVFFGKGQDQGTSAVTHVGLAIDAKKFIHASEGWGVMISSFAGDSHTPGYWGARRMHYKTMDPGGGAPEDSPYVEPSQGGIG